MWIVENEGEVFKGKKLWLRPGKRFVFGRTKVEGADGGQFVVSDKTISRQHLIVEVAPVGSSDCAKIRSRSKITLTDPDTKIGTLLNGKQIRNSTHVLEQGDNIVTLGKFKPHFRFTWVPVVFTFSFTTKEQKSDPYTKLYQTLGPLDIKVAVNYERGLTTHVIARKRNTAKGLQALVDGKYIVHNDSFVKAVLAAAEPGEDGSSALENDFDCFPDSVQYLPPGANETQKDDSVYQPDPARRDMFEGYTFIFYEVKQYDTLIAPITEAGGKALFREVLPNQITVEEFVRYVKSVAGEKGLGEFEDGSEGKGVVVVRYNPVKGAGADWYADFGTQVSLYLDHRLVEQNEFLDAILGNDASVLRRPLEPEASGVVAPPPSAVTAVNQTLQSQTLRSSQAAPTQTPAEPESQPDPPRRGRRRAAVFKGFDDDDDPPILMASIPESMAIDPSPTMEPESQSLFVSQDPSLPMDRGASQTPAPEPTIRKRKATPIEEDSNSEDTMETMAPAASRLKKRRLAETTLRRRRGESTPPPPPPEAPKTKPKIKTSDTPPKRKTKKEKDAELLQAARQEREKEEQLAAQAKAESEKLSLEGLDYNAMQALAITEEVEIKPRVDVPIRQGRADESDRWEDRWNGRKNFKKFRRRGAPPVNVRDLGRVIVPLEEVKQKAAGMGDEYWGEERVVEESQSLRVSKKSQSKSQGKSQTKTRAKEILDQDSEDDLPAVENIASHPRSRGKSASITISSDSEEEEEEEPIQRPTRGSQKEKLKDKTSERGNKRPAAAALTKAGPAKKLMSARGGRGKKDDSDSEDELKFRFRGRG